MTTKPAFVARRVLVVDDAIDVADITVEMLRSMGHEAEVAYDGTAAMRLAVIFQPEVVLVDLVMPDMDGFQLVRELHAMFPSHRPRFIAFTAHKQPAFLEAADSAGFDGHLTKPVSEKDLAAALAG